MMLTDLADVLRAGGLPVVELDGWETRGHGELVSVESIACHHTAGPRTGNYPSLTTVRDGRPDLAGPLAQLGLGRNGLWYVIAAGVCWHAGAVWETWQNNWHSIGIEAEATGTDPWPVVQYDSYVAGVAVLRAHYGVPLSHVLGHKEIAKPKGRKADPNFDMTMFRARVGAWRRPSTDQPQEDQMTPAQMQELKDFIEARSKAYAIANNNYTRQVLSSTAKALMAADAATDKAQADRIIAALQPELEELAHATVQDVPAPEAPR